MNVPSITLVPAPNICRHQPTRISFPHAIMQQAEQGVRQPRCGSPTGLAGAIDPHVFKSVGVPPPIADSCRSDRLDGAPSEERGSAASQRNITDASVDDVDRRPGQSHRDRAFTRAAYHFSKSTCRNSLMYSLSDYLWMIADGPRASAYAKRSAPWSPRRPRPRGGRRLWLFDVVAARAGAAHVDAVDTDPVIRLGARVAALNGCADRITFPSLGDIADVTLPQPADAMLIDVRGPTPFGSRRSMS